MQENLCIISINLLYHVIDTKAYRNIDTVPDLR